MTSLNCSSPTPSLQTVTGLRILSIRVIVFWPNTWWESEWALSVSSWSWPLILTNLDSVHPFLLVNFTIAFKTWKRWNCNAVPELKHLIVELSSTDTGSLVALARTHSAYQREAEKALYDTISICAFRNDSFKCLETLANNLEKAAFVRFPTIEYADDNIDNNRRVTTYLLQSLINMHSLSDFRVRSHFGKPETQMMKGLAKIVWSVGEILIFFEN